MRGVLIAIAVLCTAASLWGAFGTSPGVLSPLVWMGALWLPGAWLAVPRTPTGKARLELAWMPLAYGPILFGAAVCAGRLAGLSLAAAAGGTVFLGAIALVLRILPRGTKDTAASSSRAEPSRATSPVLRAAPAVAGSLVLMLGATPSLTHAPLRFWGDALLHLPVMARILDGPFPPENPFLAGMPLGYFWFYHAALAPVSRLSSLSPDWVLTLFNAQALCVLLLALNRAGRLLGLSPLARAASLILAGMGLTPWGWVRLLVVHATHPEISWPLVRAWGLSGLLPILNPMDPRLAGALTKIAVSNALPMSMALAVLAASPLPGPGHRVRRTVLLTGCLAFHMAIGLLLCAGLVVQWSVERFREAGTGAPPSNTSGSARDTLLPLVVALLITAPYLVLVLRAREGSLLTPMWNAGHALGLHLALAGLWVLSLPALGPWILGRDTRRWLLLGVPAAILPFAAHLVDGNEYKGIFFLLVFLAPTAGAGLERLARGRSWLVAAVLCLFIPTNVIVARSLRDEIPPGYLSPEDRRTVAAIGHRLSPDAVVWAPDPGPGYSPFTVPLGRSSYLSDTYALQIMGQWQSKEALRRRATLALAGAPETLPWALAEARGRLGGRPLVALITPAMATRAPFLDDALARMGYDLVARNPLLVLYRVSPPDSSGPSLSN